MKKFLYLYLLVSLISVLCYGVKRHSIAGNFTDQLIYLAVELLLIRICQCSEKLHKICGRTLTTLF